MNFHVPCAVCRINVDIDINRPSPHVPCPYAYFKLVQVFAII